MKQIGECDIVMKEIIFPNEPIDIGTSRKHKYVYPEDITFFYLDTDLIFKVYEDDSFKFDFSGFTSKDGEIAEYTITTNLPKFYCREVKLNE